MRNVGGEIFGGLDFLDGFRSFMPAGSMSGEDVVYTPRRSFNSHGSGSSVFVTPGEGSTPHPMDGVSRHLEGVAVRGDAGMYMHEVRRAEFLPVSFRLDVDRSVL